MSNIISGKSSLNYRGTNAVNPPNVFVKRINPNAANWKNFVIGDIWINISLKKVWMLVNSAEPSPHAGRTATWQLLSPNTSELFALKGNEGESVGPSNNTIRVVGDGTSLSTTGSGSTLTFSTGTIIADSFVANSGSATPSMGVIHIDGGNVINTQGSANTVTIAASNTSDGTTIIGKTSNAPLFTTLTAGSNVTIDNGPHSITVNSFQPLNDIQQINADTGNATGSTCFVEGVGSIFTTASLSTVTIDIPSPGIRIGEGGIRDSYLGIVPYSVLCAGAASTSPLQTINSTGSAGQILVSLGAGSLPAWMNNNNVQVSFFAYKSTVDANALGDRNGKRVVFDTILFNIGNGYQAGTGSFIAPYSGKYLLCVGVSFSVSSLSDTPTWLVNAFGQVNNGVFRHGTFYPLSGSFIGQIIGNAVVTMNKGQATFVSVGGSTASFANTISYGGSMNTFIAGALLIDE